MFLEAFKINSFAMFILVTPIIERIILKTLERDGIK